LSAAEQLPPGVEQIIPRGQIAAIVDPQFVPAADAKISDDAWVLGVEIDGQAHAYSLNLLNRHEVVNDKIGDSSFAAVW
jgi:carotenoid cleavage dioxygenase-like enzyme